MSLKLKYFTVEEADALVPKISEILKSALSTKIQIELKVEEWRKAHAKATDAEQAVFQGQVDFLAARLEQTLTEITELGAIPKDIDSGLVDFPARIDGREGYLCWKFDETQVTHWHGLTEGFQGRKALKAGEKNEKKRG